MAEKIENTLQAVYSWDELTEKERKKYIDFINPDHQIRFIACSDLLFSGKYGDSVLIYTEHQLILVEHGSIMKTLDLKEVQSAFCLDFVGNGILGAKLNDGTRIECIRYSSTLSDPFLELSRTINQDLGVTEHRLQMEEEVAAKKSAPKTEKETTRCPGCGHPLQYPSDPCPNCISKKRVAWRLLQLISGQKNLMLLGGLTSLLVVGISLCPPILVQHLVDSVLTEENATQTQRLYRSYWIVGSFFVLILLLMVFQYSRIKIMGQLSASVIMDLRRKIFRALQRLSLSYYDTEHKGRIMSRVLTDTQHIQQFVVQGLQQLCIHAMMIIAIPVMMLWAHWELALIALLPIPIAALVGRFFSKKFHAVFRTLKRRFAALSAAVSDTVSGIRVVKSFVQEDRETSQFDAKTRHIYNAHISAAKTRAKFNPSVMFIMRLGTLVVWLIGSRWIIFYHDDMITTGMLVQFITYMNMLYPHVQQVMQLTEVFEQSTTSAERVFSVMDMPSDVGDRETAIQIKDIKGRIEIQNVSFKYGDGQRVLRDVNLTIEPGEMVGLVGETGSGKSTLVSLVCRFYDPTKGQILLDGTDLTDISVKSLRNQVGMVLQSTYLFTGTIRDNISYGKPDASEREIVFASKAANAHDFIMNLPDGYDSEVGEGGAGLSGGEMQRIAIARAILKDPAILILDEATSAVDTATEQSIQEAMDRLVKGRTTIAIAHRLSTLRNADKLVVMEKGEIVEEGTHENLMREDGKYANLCKIQAEFATTATSA